MELPIDLANTLDALFPQSGGYDPALRNRIRIADKLGVEGDITVAGIAKVIAERIEDPRAIVFGLEDTPDLDDILNSLIAS